MTGEPRTNDAPHAFDEDGAQGQDPLGLGQRDHRALLDWVGENLPQVRRSVSGQRLLYWSLGIGFVVGLAAHVGGYLLASSATTELIGLVADLILALGWSLWTGVVVAVFVQVIPEAKRRQFRLVLDAYERERREKPRTGSDQNSVQGNQSDSIRRG